MSTELTEPENGVILLPTSETQIAELKASYMALTTNGPEDRAAFKLVHDAEQRCVKLRTGTVKAVKELCEPLAKQIDKYKKDGNRLIELLAPIESHLKAQKKLVDDEIARREQERADELYDLRKRRWLEATGNPPDFDGIFPEAFLRQMDESTFEAEIQRLTIKTKKEREETIARIEAEAAETKRRNEEAARLKSENDRLAAERAKFEQEQREFRAQRELQKQRDEETQRILSANRARDEADKPVAGRPTTSPALAGDVPATAPSLPIGVSSHADFHLAFDDEGYGILKFRLMEFSIGRSEGNGLSRLDEGDSDLWLEIVDTLNKHFPRE